MDNFLLSSIRASLDLRVQGINAGGDAIVMGLVDIIEINADIKSRIKSLRTALVTAALNCTVGCKTVHHLQSQIDELETILSDNSTANSHQEDKPVRSNSPKQIMECMMSIPAIGDRVRIGGQHSQAGRQGIVKEYLLSNRIARVALDPKPYWRDQSPDLWLTHVSYLTVISKESDGELQSVQKAD